MYTNTPSPWMLAAGAGGGLAGTYAEAMTRIAQIRAQQQQQAQAQQMAQQMFGYRQQQDAADELFRNKQFEQQGTYQQGMLKNAADRNDVTYENAILRAMLQGGGGSGRATLNPNDVPTSYMNKADNIQRDSIQAARTQLPRVATGEMPVQVRPAPGMAQAAGLLQALTEAQHNPDQAMSQVNSFWTQQPQPNVTPEQKVPGAIFGNSWMNTIPAQTNSWNSATVNTNAVIEALSKVPQLAPLFAQAGLPTNSPSMIPQQGTNAPMRIGRFNVIPR